MSLTITLPPDAEARLQAAADEQGLAPEELAVQTLLERFPLAAPERGGAFAPSPPAPTDAQNAPLDAEEEKLLAALPPALRDYVGKFDSSQRNGGRKSNLAENHREVLQDVLEQKRREGRL